MEAKIRVEYIWAGLIGGVIAGWLSGNDALGFAVFAAVSMAAWIDVYRQYARDNPHGLWFKRKLYGWGWVPVRWQGWLAIFLYAALIANIIVRVDRSSHSVSDTLSGVAVRVVILTALFIGLCIWKGEKPRWQWGPDKNS